MLDRHVTLLSPYSTPVRDKLHYKCRVRGQSQASAFYIALFLHCFYLLRLKN